MKAIQFFLLLSISLQTYAYTCNDHPKAEESFKAHCYSQALANLVSRVNRPASDAEQLVLRRTCSCALTLTDMKILDKNNFISKDCQVSINAIKLIFSAPQFKSKCLAM